MLSKIQTFTVEPYNVMCERETEIKIETALQCLAVCPIFQILNKSNSNFIEIYINPNAPVSALA